MTIKHIFILAAVGALAACASETSLTGPTATEKDFGNSVDSLVKAQTANPSTLSNPSTAPVTGVDPDYANSVVETMREGASKPEDIKKPIEIRVGAGGN